MNKDLTVGKPSQVLWQFCLPMFGSIIFQQLYNIADSLVAGKFIGENALAAVGNSYEITLIFIAFAFGCNIGCSVIVSRYFGAKEYREMKTSVYTSLIGSAVLCAVLMGIGLLQVQACAVDNSQTVNGNIAGHGAQNTHLDGAAGGSSGTGGRTGSRRSGRACGRTAAGSQSTCCGNNTGSSHELTTSDHLFHKNLLLRSVL